MVWETVGGKMFDTCARNLAVGGRLLVIGMMSQYGEGWPASQAWPHPWFVSSRCLHDDDNNSCTSLIPEGGLVAVGSALWSSMFTQGAGWPPAEQLPAPGPLEARRGVCDAKCS